ncbi:unnamed protein product [Merluccius merluccius]
MTRLSVSLYLLLALGLNVPQSMSEKTSSEFNLDGDYLLGGLFDIHHVNGSLQTDRPEAIVCSSHKFKLANYRKFQVMRFAVEEINNSSVLLPNVSLGYEIMDHCSPINFPGVLSLISFNGSIRFSWGRSDYRPLGKVMGVVGPFTSTDSLAVAPLFTLNLVPLVSYGAASSVLSVKAKYPAFLRTVGSNNDTVDLIVQVLQRFHWTWVAVLYSSNAYGADGLDLCIHKMMDTDICLAYTAEIQDKRLFNAFRQIEILNISVIIVFAGKQDALLLIEAAAAYNISNKVWIATEPWHLSKKISNRSDIERIGTILGLTQKTGDIPGFDAFVKSRRRNNQKTPVSTAAHICNQDCSCGALTGEEILDVEFSYNVQVYMATYAIAHALHKVLRCDSGSCHTNGTVYPYMVLDQLKKTNITVLDLNVQFNKFGAMKFPFLDIEVWTMSGLKKVGTYQVTPTGPVLSINSKIQWHTNGTVPVSVCSRECPVGYAKRTDGIHRCCFKCERCRSGTYLNITEDAYKCKKCAKTEWSLANSTSCKLRSVEYIPLMNPVAIVILAAAMALAGLSLAIAALFATNYSTPVVKSAGGLMCFLILGCLSLCTISIFFYFGKPTAASCILRYLPFMLFFTACLACFVVRAFQIVCVFKMAAKFPKIYSWWVKYNGQWLLIAVPVLMQALLLTVGYASKHPKPHNETALFPDKIILGCGMGNAALFFLSTLLLILLVVLCFTFSYMGKDLPKNYNEAKAITFCLLLLILTWVFYVTTHTIYQGKYIQTFNALAVLSSLYSVLLWYFLPKCYIILFQPQRNTPQYFQGLIQSYTKQISTQ